MKHFFRYFFIMMLIATEAVSFAGCSKDDDSNGGEGGSIDGHEYVDLGLPSGTLWATCNVGASSPEDYGYYFAWGETTGYGKDESHSFDWANYKWCFGSEKKLSKYCTVKTYGTVDRKTELESTDDAATQIWGASWQTPSVLQIKELIDATYTTTSWVCINNVYGRKVTSKTNGNSIFLPSAEYRTNSYNVDFVTDNDNGYYWSRNLNPSDCRYAYGMEFDHDTPPSYDTCSKPYACPIRPVHSTQNQ